MVSSPRIRVVLLALLLLCVPTTAALATPKAEIRAKRAEAVAAQAELQQLGIRFEQSVNAWEQAQAKVDAVRARIATNNAAIARITQTNTSVRSLLTARLTADYRQGDQDLFLQALTSGSLSDILDRLTYQKQLEQSTGLLALQLRQTSRELATRRAGLARDQRAAVSLEATAQARKQEVEQAQAAQSATVTRLKRQVAGLVQEEKDRQQRLRAQYVARVAAARAAAARVASALPDPGIGGSGGPLSISDPVIPGGSDRGSIAAQEALKYLGVPYVWGGSSPSGFDCSGLTQWAWRAAGVSLDHYTGSQLHEGQSVSIDNLQVGDLIFFYGGSHVGLYIGQGQFVQAPHTGDVVKVSPLSGYYRSNFYAAVRPG
jgi:cell wall-associated NlpC family hydrolase